MPEKPTYEELEQRVLELEKSDLKRKKVEDALRESEVRFRRFFMNAPLPYQSLDENGNFIEVNSTFLEILGYSQDEVIGKNFGDFLHPDWVAHFKENFPRFKAVGEVLGVEFEMVKKDGSTILVSFNGKIQRDDQNRFARTHCIFQDITSRKQAEEALLTKTRILENIFESAPYIMMLVTEEGRVTDINRSGIRFTGRSKDELLGLLGGEVFGCLNSFDGRGCGKNDVCEFCPVRSRVKHTFETGEPVYEGRGQLDVLSGGVSISLEILVSTTPVPSAEGRQVLVTILDITDRVRADEAIIEREKYLRTILQATEDGFFVFNIEGKFTETNDAYCRMCGYTRDEFLKLDISCIDTVEHPTDNAARIQRIVSNGSETFETRHRRKDGSVFDVEISASYMNTNGGMLVCFCRDITERKKAEEEKARLESRLRQTQKMESIGSLAGGIAHDLNNILFPISGLSEMLLDEIPPDNPANESIEQIHKSSQRGSELVKQILAFSRQNKPQKLPIRIQSVLKEVLKLVRSTIPANIDIKSHINSDCGLVSADPTQVHQIAMNLIANAYHAVEAKGGTIDFKLKETVLEKDDLHDILMKPGKYACITISDTGIGIDHTLIDKIFDPYFTTKEQGKGTGLGLSVVHGIVKEHGGDIRVYSEVGKGTAFHVYLPLITDVRDSKPAGVTSKYPTGSENILLVDDEEPIAKMVQMMLAKLGYQVTTRTSSPDALDAFKSNPSKFDLVISDRGMPNMTGEQLAREIISVRPEIPVIICTGFSDENDEKRAREIGVKGFLKKPIATGDLAETVRKVLDELADSVLMRDFGQADADNS